jgi:aspartokinase/homoserine dehydrogenase 1
MAGALDATDLEIWTDVNGGCIPPILKSKQAQPIASISYQEAMELSQFGAERHVPKGAMKTYRH